MTDNETKDGLEFKDFIDKSTNLLTVVGIFNALAVFGTSFDDREIGSFVAFMFTVLSLLVFHELLQFTIKSNNKDWKYDMFINCIVLVEVALVFFVIKTYSLYVVLFGFFGLTFIIALAAIKLVTNIKNKKFSSLFNKYETLIRAVIVLVAFAAAFTIYHYLIPVLQPLIRPIETVK